MDARYWKADARKKRVKIGTRLPTSPTLVFVVRDSFICITGLSRSVKYAIIVGVGIPGLLCTIGLACYILNKLKTIRHQHLQNSDPQTTTVLDQRPGIRATSGLELTTIESYPKTVVGQSRRLSDNTCPICLCEYQPKETLRSIPECSHYFHVDCIDEWLKLNGTCPLCRNSLGDSSNATSCFSTPLSSS